MRSTQELAVEPQLKNHYERAGKNRTLSRIPHALAAIVLLLVCLAIPQVKLHALMLVMYLFETVLILAGVLTVGVLATGAIRLLCRKSRS